MKLDLSVEIPSELVRSALFETIESQLKMSKYQITLGAATKQGDLNFTGIVYRVWFSKEEDATNEISTASSIILKIAPQNLAHRIQFTIRPAFVREIYTYDKVNGLLLISFEFFLHIYLNFSIFYSQIFKFGSIFSIDFANISRI